MVKKKVLTEEQARLSVQSNVILKALGVKPDVEVEWHELPYLKGDRFVLCSDGFWGAMPEKDFIALVTKKANIKEILQETSNKVEALGNEKGEDYDNLTAAIIDMESNSKMQVKMNTLAKTIICLLTVILLVSIGLNGYQHSMINKLSAVTPDTVEIKKPVVPPNDSAATMKKEEGDSLPPNQSGHEKNESKNIRSNDVKNSKKQNKMK